ncbi:hypothetical protein F5Y17DRAFT_438958 [Xylariaceae sp. FL0594]|nr:hypothetical protein F5Y17DRAFT_438958 [Xylariaceae sp. FL0594]
MFGTLKINSKHDSVEFIEHAKGEAATRLGGYVFSKSACERCRVKKLGCSKHRSGCDRCKDQGLQCSYQASQSQARTPRAGREVGPGSSLSPPGNRAADSEAVGWAPDETGRASSSMTVVTSPGPSNSDLTHGRARQFEDSSTTDPSPGLSLGSEIGYSETELDGLFSTIAGLHPDHMETDVFTGAVYPSLLDSSVLGSMTRTAAELSMMAEIGEIGDMAVSQPASADPVPQSPFLAFDDLGSGSSSPSLRQAIGGPVSGGDSATRAAVASCQCQESTVRVLAEVESKILSATPGSLFDVLSYHRQATTASNNILTSRACDCKVELFGLLEILSVKITRFSQAIIAAFLRHVKEQSDSVDLSVHEQEPAALDSRLRCVKNGALQLGAYQVQSLQEFIVISAAAIRLQLKLAVNFVSRTRALAATLNLVVQAQGLKTLESRLRDLSIKMERLALNMESEGCDV